MCITMLMLSFPKEKRGTAMGVSSLVMGVAPALGPALSGIFVDHFSWRAIFILGSVLAAIVILLAVSMQVVVTPLKTWGLNSLDNSLVPHGTPIQNTFVSVGGSLDTAMVVSIGALAGSQYMQVHLGFICMAVFALAYFLMMVVFVKEKR